MALFSAMISFLPFLWLLSFLLLLTTNTELILPKIASTEDENQQEAEECQQWRHNATGKKSAIE
jgi:hypothetical protein